MKNQEAPVMLPITGFKSQIEAAFRENAVTIITAETGAGKSTQVPQYLLDMGHHIVVTQPRRLAARTVAARVAFERGCDLGGEVGFRTAHERKDSGATRCLFVTDGLALVRELMGAGKHNVLVLDEVHEWNLNMEVLVAWTKRQVALPGNKFKVVVMSATLEAEKLSAFFNGAPVISVPGRLYPVEERPAGRELETDVADLLRQGRNVLVFQPGKREISETVDAIQKSGISVEVLPLHGELDSSDQAKCFKHYSRPKCVVSTNVAQTSVTIDDIDAVVDSGMERRVELVDGVEGLYLKPVSIADSRQRKGRAGRCKPGIYIDHCGSASRLDFPKAEVLRTRLDQTVLRLAEAGIDMEELEFFHQPPKSEIHEAKRSLRALGCMDAHGNVTPIGRLVSKLPISVQYARMVVEAERLGVVDDVVTVAAILEQGEISARLCKACKQNREKSCNCWQRLVPAETTSDIMAQLALYKAAGNMNRSEMEEKGVFAKAFFQAKEKRQHLADALRGKVRFGTSGEREKILRAVCAGMVDHLYQKEYGVYKNGDSVNRELGRESVLARTMPDWLVGFPFDLEIQTRRGLRVLRLVRMASKVEPTWLADVAPQLVERKTGLRPAYSPEKDTVVSVTEVYFNSQKVKEETVADPEHVEAANIFCVWLVAQMV